jgi:MFS family permease
MDRNLKKYYLHRFILELASAKGSFFTMAYFYMLGLPAWGVVLATVVYSITALCVLRPVRYLVNNFGVKNTFMLHLIPLFVQYIVTVNVNSERTYFIYIINFIHAISLMLYRIPVDAYFSRFGNEKDRGKEVGYSNILSGVSGIVFAVFFGTLLDNSGFAIVITIQFLVHLIASFVLWDKKDPNLKIFVETKISKIQVPARVIKTYFLGHLPYAFMADLFFIWVTLHLGSFTLVGIFVGLKMALEMMLSFIVGYLTDASRIKTAFYITVALSSVLWILVPFADQPLHVFMLQFFLGISGLIISIPIDREYYNLAQQSGNEVSFAIIKEKSIMLGMILGGIISIVLILLVKNWYLLLPLAAIFGLAQIFMFRGDKNQI